MTRLLFLGNKPIAERCFGDLLACAGDRLEVVAAVTNVEGERVWWGTAGVADHAGAAGIPVVDNRERDDAGILDLVGRERVDVIVSVQHPWILPASVLDAVSGSAFNLHCAPLPDLKGYNAANHAILDGRSDYGATIHWMTPEPDAADIAFEERFPVAPDETARSLHAKATEAGVRLFRRLVEALRDSRPVPLERRAGEGVFHTRASLDAVREIADPGDLADLDRRARALHFPPFEPAYVVAGERRFHVIPAWEAPCP